MGPDPRWKHLSTEVNFGTATVTGTLTTEAGDVPVRLRMTESEGEWKPEPLHVPRIHVPGEGLPKNTEVNGQKVNLGSKTLVTDLLVWPGTLTVVLPKDKFTTYSQRKSTEQLTQQVSSIGIGQRVTVDVNAERTSEFSKQAEKAAVARVKTCLRSTVLEPKNCPFGGTVSDSVSKVADVHYTQTAPFTRWKLTGSPGSESIWGTGGRIVVAATGVTTTAQGTKVPTRISGSWETLVGDVAVRSGKVVFTSH